MHQNVKNDETMDIKPFNPLAKLIEPVLKWIYETGTEEQKTAIIVELQGRISDLEDSARMIGHRLERAQRLFKSVTEDVPF